MKLSKKRIALIIVFISILLLIHLSLIIIGLVPRTKYCAIGQLNIVSLLLCIILVTTVLIGVRKKNGKVIFFSIVIQYLILLPSIIIGFFLTNSFETGSTENFKNYLILDEKETILDVKSYFPLEVEEEYVEWYRYYHIDSTFPGFSNATEVSLKIKPDEANFKRILLDLKERFPNATYQVFSYNNEYQEITFKDEFDYNFQSKRAIVKKILYNEKDNTIIYEYIYNGNCLTDEEYMDLYYVSKIIELPSKID